MRWQLPPYAHALGIELDRRGERAKLKSVNIQVEFMRGGTQQRTFAMGSVTRAGRRVALVKVEAWQDDRAKPIALAQMKILLSASE
jgi:acyl-coenzyme A thioesterase PaaI-like protein